MGLVDMLILNKEFSEFANLFLRNIDFLVDNTTQSINCLENAAGCLQINLRVCVIIDKCQIVVLGGCSAKQVINFKSKLIDIGFGVLVDERIGQTQCQEGKSSIQTGSFSCIAVWSEGAVLLSQFKNSLCSFLNLSGFL
eukprot:TRINITY_DN4523_c0_g1_i1.p1 TRINITY_DN4523_c0_g1~~TRINITY_DN4523_c0_g1_i1.p1  ORF type:complete len:139 (+),score=36.69 TRINITY_DN4523_c0_g1_i1:1351-1767(+)